MATCDPELRASLSPRTRGSACESRVITPKVSSREWSSTISHSQSPPSTCIVETTRA